MWTTVVAVLLSISFCCGNVDWISLFHHNNESWNASNSSCLKMSDFLSRAQITLCTENLEVMPFVVKASVDTLKTCQHLFALSRWNCSSLRLAPNFMPDLKEGTREQAFVQSLASSALVLNVARAYGSSELPKCRCRGRSVQASKIFKCRGCGDSIAHACRFAQLFTSVNLPSIRNSTINTTEIFKNKVDLHNYAVGRTIASSSLRSVCKCHGASGSCAFKTCWKVLDSLHNIGSKLMEKFLLATEVRFRRRRNGSFHVIPVKTERKKKKIKSSDLIFRSISSDYCLPDPSLGSIGTKGRQCHVNASGPGKCRTLCCGRGFKTENKVVDVKCHCKYIWCCYVKCDTCRQVLKVYTCR